MASLAIKLGTFTVSPSKKTGIHGDFTMNILVSWSLTMEKMVISGD